MINTILFDLDGTLLRFSQDEFIRVYFGELSKVFAKMGMDAKKSSEAVWSGTVAMARNDGSVLNKKRFWSRFAEQMELSSEELSVVESACDSFYENEFDNVKSILKPSDDSTRIVRSMIEKGYTVVLATNPLFPLCGVSTRLSWIGLSPSDFALVTHYDNSSFCKPNPEYFREVLNKIGKEPAECLMVGNNPAEDMVAAKLGADVFLVTDCIENEHGVDISGFRRGTLKELEAYLNGFPDLLKMPSK